MVYWKKSCEVKKVKFTKMQACGNDYIYINALEEKIEMDLETIAKVLSNRHFAIGGDGVVFLYPSTVADFRMRMFNLDGSEGEMCGNALRSISKYAYEKGIVSKEEFTIETLGGIQRVQVFVEDGIVRNVQANIGNPVFKAKDIPVRTDLDTFINQPVQVLDREFMVSSVSWGNPHAIIFVDDVANFEVEKYGKALENMTDLYPNKVNVSFVQVLDRENVKMRVWERGSGETLGCGTGCASVAVISATLNHCNRKMKIQQRGGTLEMNWDEETNDLYMKGEPQLVFEAEIDIEAVMRSNP